jgi:hypothetical protein
VAVTFGDDLTATLLDLRALAESAMVDTCTINPVTGVSDSTGAPTLGTAIYTGKCKFQTSEVQEDTPEAGGKTYTALRGEIHLPVSAFTLPTPWVQLVASCVTAPLDTNMPGRKFRMSTTTPPKSMATAYRLPIKEVV